jgi:hypothetical protein
MGVRLSLVLFVGGAAISVGTSWVLISRMERLGEWFGLS